MIKFKLKEMMDKREMTIKEVHEVTGISRNTLSNMYNGKTNGIQFENLDKLLGALNCTTEDLLDRLPPPITFFFRYEDDKCVVTFGDIKNPRDFEITYDVNYDFEIPELNITNITGPGISEISQRRSPINDLSYFSISLLDIFFYVFVDMLLKEGKLEGNLETLLVSHSIRNSREYSFKSDAYTIVDIVDDRVNSDILHHLASKEYSRYGSKMKVTVQDKVIIEFI